MKILIGSTAINQYVDTGRVPKDADYFTDKEVHADLLEKERIDPYSHKDIVGYFGNVERIATLDELYTIKYSHIFWELRNGSWGKHASDIMLMQEHGAKIIEPLFKILYHVWEEKHGYKKANLSQMANDFFNDKVIRKYDHDSVHASVAYYDEPLFNVILADGEQVKVDRSKFEAMTYEDKLRLVREEVYATALERLVIPSDYTYSPRKAYAWALKRTVTSLARGWFARFIVDNLADVWKPDVDYVQVHKDNSHKLIPLKEKQ